MRHGKACGGDKGLPWPTLPPAMPPAKKVPEPFRPHVFAKPWAGPDLGKTHPNGPEMTTDAPFAITKRQTGLPFAAQAPRPACRWMWRSASLWHIGCGGGCGGGGDCSEPPCAPDGPPWPRPGPS